MGQQGLGDEDAETHVLVLAAAACPRACRIIGLADAAENRDIEARPVVGDPQHHRFLVPGEVDLDTVARSEEHPSELQSLMRISYAVFCLKKKKTESQYVVLSK